MMLSKDLQSLISQLEITTRKQIVGPLLGDAHSAVKGSGFEFNQLREYLQGDDIRFIDWKASARSSTMLVRQYFEDRNRTMYIVLDVSASTNFGTQRDAHGNPLSKKDMMRQLAAVLAFVSLHKKDSVGLILFSDHVEKFIPPGSSRNHILTLVKAALSFEAQKTTTLLSAPLEYLARRKGQKALVCLISDFMGHLDSTLLSLIARKHDLLAFRCLDPREKTFPHVGALIVEDSETQVRTMIAGSGASTFDRALEQWQQRQKEQLRAARIDSVDLEVGKPLAGPLVKFLRHRVYG